MELVSVIVPIYKVEAYLEKCVRSIREQTYPELEILLVDDGSPDRCPQMCEEYMQEDGRIRVIHKENGGLGDARNAGVLAAHGTYLLFVDSDDWIHKSLVETTVEAAEREGADIVLFDYAGVEEEGAICDLYTFAFPEGKKLDGRQYPDLIMRSCSAVNKLFRREFWVRCDLEFPKGQYYEDLATIPKVMALAERVVYEKKVLYYYLMRGGSIMHSTDFSKNYRDRTKAADSVLAFFERAGLRGEFEKELEYLVFENAYFIPSKEIVLNDRKSPYLERFREYARGKFPELEDNPYVRGMDSKSRIQWMFLKRRCYGALRLLSYMRRVKDYIVKNRR